ncbi:MAG: AMIN domain-containing protein, partial [Steroidobacteraceae bacterium]
MKRFIPQMLRGRICLMALIGAAGMLVGLNAQAQSDAAAAGNQLQSIDVQKLNGNQLQLTLHLSGPAPEPLAFTVDKPARISLDIPNTSLSLSSRRIDVGANGVDSIIAAEANGRSRVVLNLDQQLPYQTHVSGNDIVVTVGTQVAARAVASAAPAAAPAAAAAAPSGG